MKQVFEIDQEQLQNWILEGFVRDNPDLPYNPKGEVKANLEIKRGQMTCTIKVDLDIKVK